MKKTLAAILALVMVLSMLPAGLIMSSALTSGDYTYTVSNSKARISGYSGTGGALNIPGELGGYPVTTISNAIFQGNNTITSVVFPDSVTEIQYQAFTDCTKITSITFGTGLTTIGRYAFSNTLISTVLIPAGVTSIEYNVFSDCHKLTGAYFFGNAPTMGTNVFSSCASGFKVYYTAGKTGYTNPWNTYTTVAFSDVNTITFNSNGGSAVASLTQSYGSLVAKPADPAKEDFNFGGWFSDAALTTPVIWPYTHISDVMFYAKWNSLGGYTIVFNANGGMGGTCIALNAGEALLPPTVTRAGYTFTGWSPSPPPSVPPENTTYNAQWTANSYVVTFDAQGGSVSPTSKEVTYNGFYESMPTPIKTGYNFGGWYTSTGGAGTRANYYTTVTITEAQTLYAKWTASSYTVTFDTGGGSVSPTTKTVTYASTYGTLPIPTKTGYVFGGWYTGADGTGMQVLSSTMVTITSAQTLYATWSTSPTYTVSFDAGGGTVSPSSITVTYGSVYGELPTPTKAGYTFGGWYTQPYAPPPFYTGSRVFPISQVTITQAQTLFARWTANTYTVTFDPQGGSVSPATITVTYAGTYGTLPTPTRTDYTFGGWYTSPAGAGTQILNSTPVSITAAQTLYAKWTSNGPVPADYTQLNALIAQAEGLDRNIYTEDSLAALDEALGNAYDAVAAEYELPMQAAVDDITALLQNAIDGLVYQDADYSMVDYIWANKPADLSNYTDESVAALMAFYNSIYWGYANPDQIIVDDYAYELIRLINALVLKPADYDDVDYALREIPDNDGGQIAVDWNYLYSVYTSSSVNNLQNAVNAVVRGKPIIEQQAVNGYAAAIGAATRALVPLSADYTYLGIALNTPPAWPASYYTSATYTPYTDALATGWVLFNNQNLSSTHQFIIDDATEDINDAYATLTLKDVTYTVKYQTTGGTTLAADAVKNATAADWVTETAVTVPGYTPVQATIQQRMTGTSAENIITFTYTYTIAAYTVTFNSNGGSAVTAVTQNENTTVAKPADPVKTGYSFAGWYSDAGLSSVVSWPYTLTGNVTFYAKWTPTTTYKITFNSNGGSSVAAITQNANTTVAKPADPAKTGYTFKGWYLDSSFTNAVTWPYTLAANVTFYAKWTRNYYIVTFDAQGGTVDPVNRSIGYGYSYSPLPTPVKTNFVFMGWYTQPNGLGTRIIAADGVEIAQDHTLYAKWIPVTNVTVTLNAMGGTISPPTVTLTVGLPYGDLPVPTKAGYAFAGWYQSPPSTWSYDYVLHNFIVANESDHTLYARWSNPRYNLDFDPNGGSGGVLLGYSLPVGTMVTISLFPYFAVNFDVPPGEDPIYVPQIMLQLPTRPGYTFVGWSMSSFMMPAHDVTVSAIWSPNLPVNIAFDTDGGSAIAPMSGNPGDPLTPPADPTRTGYTFLGWSPSIPPSVPDDDATYTAMWQANCYMITFNANGGTGGTSITLECGSPLTPPTVARTGFVFAGWSSTLPATVGAGDADYTALWRMLGDLTGNDSVTSADALLALQASAEIISPTEIQLLAADVNQSGTVTSADALKILQYSAGLITSF